MPVSSVAAPPSAANVSAAPVAGPPAATSWPTAVTFSSGPGNVETRCTTSSVHSPTNSPRGSPDKVGQPSLTIGLDATWVPSGSVEISKSANAFGATRDSSRRHEIAS